MIQLYTRNATLEKLIRDAMRGETVGGIAVNTPAWKDRPRTANYVVTKSGISSDLSRYAATAFAMLIVVPEGLEYLTEKCKEARVSGRNVVVLGDDYRNPDRDGK